VICGGALIVEYFAVPSNANQNTVYSILGKAAVVCILLGVRLHRPRERLGWFFLAAAIGCFTLGDDLTTYYQEVLHNLPFPSYADALYLAGYPFLFAGVLRLTRNPGRVSSREDTADSAIVALGAFALSWQFLMNSYVHDATLSTFGMLVNVTYPMMDVALIFIIFRALYFQRTRFPYQQGLAWATGFVFIGDMTFDLLTLHNSYTTGNVVDAFFLLQYVALAASALHPSMAWARGGAPSAQGAPSTGASEDTHRMPVIILAGFIPPLILIVASAAGVTVNVLALSSICVAVFLVICLRLIWLVRRITTQSHLLVDNVSRLGALEERFRLAFEANMAPMIFTDLDDRVIAANDAFCSMIGYQRSELMGRDSKPFTHPDDVGITEDVHRRIRQGNADQSRYVKRYVRKDGRVIVVEISRSVARDVDGHAMYNVISERDITDERNLAAQLSEQALHDSLTGLANRSLFVDRLSQAHSRVVREGGLCAVLLLDLDDFKGVNDSLGHMAGDHLLIEIARRLELVTRSSDTLCRFGGDEFLYLAEGIHTPEDAEGVARRLLGALTEPFVVLGTRIEQRASIGVVVSDASRSEESDFIQDADVALYEAKREGKGNFVLFTPSMHQQAARQFTMVQELRKALEAGQISMHYQPIVELATQRVVGFEALMRWLHPERGFVAPHDFIAVAEQSDLIIELGRFALRTAIQTATTWQTLPGGETGPFVTVNLSARQFHDPTLVDSVVALLGEHGLAHELLIIELTERVTLSNVSDTMTIMENFARHGIAFALDDFGTGFSSLSYLALLQPKIIKIDQSFVSPTSDDPRIHALLEAIMTLGHRLHMTMLAEGVETTAQLERLRRFNCELGQGFLWSRAVPASDVPAILTRGVEPPGHRGEP
jgi:diguanylate cyclase (GGDEF)-like protein/PAS domain S-box-containing protein